MPRLLYDLCGDDDLRFSPYCWRTKLALAHKGLDYDTVPVRFKEKPKIAFSGQKLVPVLDDNDTVVFDSWAIAEYLEDTYTDAPTLFPGADGRNQARLSNEWINAQHGELLSFIILDVHNCLNDEDRAYFRATREERFGKTLEDMQAGREDRVGHFREITLAPLRAHLADRPFISGAEPAYSDYATFGTFQWARLTSDFDVLAPGDAVYDWRARMIARL